MIRKVAVIMGSDSDLPVVKKAIDTLSEYGVPFEVHVYSAHRTPEEARSFSMNARANGFGAIIAAAGKAAHLAGALAATFGVVFPSFAVIFAISMFLDNFLEITVIASAFRGIKIAVGILILNAGITMLKKMRISGSGQARSPRKGLFPMAVMACSFAVMLLINIFSWNISTICLMLAAAAVGLAASAAGGFAGSLPARKGGEKK